MLVMDHFVTVGDTELGQICSVKISKDVAKLTDTATIVCPAVSHGRTLSYVGKVRKWQEVHIALGYDGNLREEFAGYVKSVALEGEQMRIECEDALLLFQRVDMPNGELLNPSIKDVLAMVLKNVNEFIRRENLGPSLSLNCLYDYKYDKFCTINATAYTILDLIQKEGAPNIYIADNVLNVVPQYTNSTGEASYSPQRNICKDGLKLKWREESDRSLYVVVSATGADGKKVEATAGKKGENEFKLDLGNRVTDLKSLQAIADNQLKRSIYTGYEGSFQGWLVPFCDAGYIVSLTDEANELHNGRYYVTSVAVEYSSSGGVRTVSLGAAVSG